MVTREESKEALKNRMEFLRSEEKHEFTFKTRNPFHQDEKLEDIFIAMSKLSKNFNYMVLHGELVAETNKFKDKDHASEMFGIELNVLFKKVYELEREGLSK